MAGNTPESRPEVAAAKKRLRTLSHAPARGRRADLLWWRVAANLGCRSPVYADRTIPSKAQGCFGRK